MKVAREALPIRRALLALLASLVTLAAAAAARAETIIVSGKDVAVYNLAGDLRVEAGAGPSVTVDVTRGGRDGGKLKIAQDLLDGRQALRVLYPGNRIVYPRTKGWSSTSMAVTRDGRFEDKCVHGIAELFARHVSIHSGGSGDEAYADLVVRVPRGQKISIYVGVGAASVSNVDGELYVSTNSGTVNSIQTRGKLSLDTGSGDVAVAEASGDLIVDTGSGDVRVNKVSGNSVSLDTGSGKVAGAALVTGRLHVNTGSGSIDLERVACPDVDLDTGSGSVALGLTSDVDRLKIDTGSGSVRVTAPETISARVHVDTGSGGISTDLPMKLTEKTASSLIGTIGDGRGTIVIDTGSGSVKLFRGTGESSHGPY